MTCQSYDSPPRTAGTADSPYYWEWIYSWGKRRFGRKSEQAKSIPRSGRSGLFNFVRSIHYRDQRHKQKQQFTHVDYFHRRKATATIERYWRFLSPSFIGFIFNSTNKTSSSVPSTLVMEERLCLRVILTMFWPRFVLGLFLYFRCFYRPFLINVMVLSCRKSQEYSLPITKVANIIL